MSWHDKIWFILLTMSLLLSHTKFTVKISFSISGMIKNLQLDLKIVH